MLKQAAKRANAEARPAAANAAAAYLAAGAVAPVDDFPADLDLPFATCKLGALTVGQFLEAYTQRPVETRPNLEDPEAMAGVLRDIWARELLVAEAQRRGLNESDLVRRRVHADRSSLARQWALEQVTKKAVEAMKEPGIEARLREWHAAHLKTLYTTRDENGTERVLGFEAERELVESDYSSDLQERLRAQEMQRLRRGRSVWVDEGLLDRLPVRWPAAPVPPALKASDAAWDGDTRDHVAKRGETHTRFVLRNKTGVGQATIEVESSKGAKTLTLNLTYARDRAAR